MPLDDAPLIAIFPQNSNLDTTKLSPLLLDKAAIVLHMLNGIRSDHSVDMNETPSSDGFVQLESVQNVPRSWDFTVELGDDMIVPSNDNVRSQSSLSMAEQIQALESLVGQNVLAVTSKHGQFIQGIVQNVALDDDYQYDNKTSYTVKIREVLANLNGKVRHGDILIPPDLPPLSDLPGLDSFEAALKRENITSADQALNGSIPSSGIAECIRVRAELKELSQPVDTLRSHFLAGPILGGADWLGNLLGKFGYVLNGSLDADTQAAYGTTAYVGHWINLALIQDPALLATQNVFFEQLIAGKVLRNEIDYKYLNGDLLIEGTAYERSNPPRTSVKFEDCFSNTWRLVR